VVGAARVRDPEDIVGFFGGHRGCLPHAEQRQAIADVAAQALEVVRERQAGFEGKPGIAARIRRRLVAAIERPHEGDPHRRRRLIDELVLDDRGGGAGRAHIHTAHTGVRWREGAPQGDDRLGPEMLEDGQRPGVGMAGWRHHGS
jgi:hypothetical protein